LKLQLGVSLASAFLTACPERPARQTRASASAVVAVPPSASVAPPTASAEAPPPPQVFSPDELKYAVHAEPTDTGWIALVLRDASDAAKQAPLRLVSLTNGSMLETIELPCSYSGDLKGSPRLAESNLPAKRFLIAEGDLPKIRMRIWSLDGE